MFEHLGFALMFSFQLFLLSELYFLFPTGQNLRHRYFFIFRLFIIGVLYSSLLPFFLIFLCLGIDDFDFFGHEVHNIYLGA